MMQIFQDIEAALSGHADIQNDDVPILFCNLLDRFLSRFCFPEYDGRERLAKGFLEPPANDWMIVGNKDFHRTVTWRVRGAGAESSGSLWYRNQLLPLS